MLVRVLVHQRQFDITGHQLGVKLADERGRIGVKCGVIGRRHIQRICDLQPIQCVPAGQFQAWLDETYAMMHANRQVPLCSDVQQSRHRRFANHRVSRHSIDYATGLTCLFHELVHDGLVDRFVFLESLIKMIESMPGKMLGQGLDSRMLCGTQVDLPGGVQHFPDFGGDKAGVTGPKAHDMERNHHADFLLKIERPGALMAPGQV